MTNQRVIYVRPDLKYVGPTRRAVRDHLTDCGVEQTADAELMLSELIGNAIVHGGRDITVTVRCAPDRTRVEVSDGSPVIPQPQRHDPLRPGGHGLRIVEALALRWGVRRTPGDGKTVWFEVPSTATAG